jgi:hypothetical protein
MLRRLLSATPPPLAALASPPRLQGGARTHTGLVSPLSAGVGEGLG